MRWPGGGGGGGGGVEGGGGGGGGGGEGGGGELKSLPLPSECIQRHLNLCIQPLTDTYILDLGTSRCVHSLTK